MSDIRVEYDRLKELGDDFFEMFPSMTGEWENDKKEFTKYYNMNKDILG